MTISAANEDEAVERAAAEMKDADQVEIHANDFEANRGMTRTGNRYRQVRIGDRP